MIRLLILLLVFTACHRGTAPSGPTPTAEVRALDSGEVIRPLPSKPGTIVFQDTITVPGYYRTFIDTLPCPANLTVTTMVPFEVVRYVPPKEVPVEVVVKNVVPSPVQGATGATGGGIDISSIWIILIAFISGLLIGGFAKFDHSLRKQDE